MKEIKALVLCSTRFAIPSIQQLLHAKMLCAVAVPGRIDDIAEHAEAVLQGSGIPVIRLTAAYEHELKNIITEHSINLCLVLTFSLKIRATVFTMPLLGFYNFHPGPLPLYRGTDPIFQQIKRMEEYAGLTIHRLDENFDTGPVVMKEKIRIDKADTYGMLTTKLGFLAAKMLGVLLKMLSLGIDPPSRPQSEKEATYYKKQIGADVTIRWNSMSADEISALANACNPWNKGALTQINQMIMRLPQAKKLTGQAISRDHLPGTIISLAENEMIIAVINNEAVAVPFVYLEEGFLNAGQLALFGLLPGSRFGELNK